MRPPNYILKNKAKIASLIPANQAIPYKEENWVSYFPNDTDFKEISTNYPTQISRQNIFDIKTSLGTNPSSKQLRMFFLAVMLWGFGKTGYGAYRTHKMICDPSFLDTIKNSFDEIQRGNIINAYNCFSLDKCGSAFFTKYFYFSGQGSAFSPKPLILDAVVARSLEDVCDGGISRYAKVSRYTENIKAKAYDSDSAGEISSVGESPNGYMNYIHDMEDWASSLEVTPDQIELFLFS
ncbi:MAG: hypothetical protein PHH87_07640 [Desulfuromonas sp.]|nr:hypothetical protein [Desulfuromonas sp.]